MRSGKLKIAFYFHMHQPYYKNLLSGEYALPWVRLHASKDYYGMVAILKNYPWIKINFNMVPSLLIQLDDYTHHNAEDPYMVLSKKPAEELETEDKLFILKNFFSANIKNYIAPYERYNELLQRRGALSTPEYLEKILPRFTNQDFLDLQVWFRLVWLDELVKNDFAIKALYEKGRNFHQSDKEIIIDKEKQILEAVIPEYKAAYERNQIELTTSPFYHPIMPLLADSRIAEKSSQRYKTFPPPFSFPNDLDAQVHNAVETHAQYFNKRPTGMWPSEGAVSMDVLPYLIKYGIQYFATDEEILALSLGWGSLRDQNRELADPSILYTPYEIIVQRNKITALFRDKLLSDLISFFYQNFNTQDAAQDFINKLKNIHDRWDEKYDPLVLIVMDGENAWEWYPHNGRTFFDTLFMLIKEQPWLETVLIPEYLQTETTRSQLPTLHPGSWINHDFGIWIGHPEDNKAWSLLKTTRDLIDSNVNVSPEAKKTAMESIYIAEGSDWYWWFGDEHSSEHDEVFDEMFRTHLANVYSTLNLIPPEALSVPIKEKAREGLLDFISPPTSMISPHLDGEITSYFEWLDAGELKLSHLFSTHRPSQIPVKKILFGFDNNALYFRIDLEEDFIYDFISGTLKIHVNFIVPEKNNFIVFFDKNFANINGFVHDQPITLNEKTRAVIGNILEIAIARSLFPQSTDYQLRILFYQKNMLFLELPPHSSLIISSAYSQLLMDWTA